MDLRGDHIIFTPSELEAFAFEIAARAVTKALKDYTKMKPLMTERDVMRTLAVKSRQTFISKHQPHIPPLWLEGSKRWHPDAVDAYIRSLKQRR